MTWRVDAGSTKTGNNRSENSLGKITKDFMWLLRSASNGDIDRNAAADTLNVKKRRIYDITNVRRVGYAGKDEGCGMVCCTCTLRQWHVLRYARVNGHHHAYFPLPKLRRCSGATVQGVLD